MNSYNPIQNQSLNITREEIDITRFTGSLWRGKWFILAFVLSCFIGAELYVRFLAVPLYPATTMIALEEGQPKRILTEIESLTSKVPITEISINTELEVLRSHDLVGQLVDSLELTKQVEFNRYLRKPPLTIRIKSYLFKFFSVTFEEPQFIPSTDKIRSSVISSVINAMKFSNSRNTLVINISATTTNSALSVLMVNKMAELYIKSQIQIKLDTLASATKFLSNRTFKLKNDFEGLKTKLANFSNQSELINSTILETQELQLRDLRMRLTEIKELVLGANVRQASLQALRDEDNPQIFIDLADDFRMNRVFLQYESNNISLSELNREIKRFMIDIKAEAERLQTQFVALESSESLMAKQIDRQFQELIIFQQLEHEVEAARLLYESFFTRLLEMEVQLGLETANGRILSVATERGRSSPIKQKVTSLFVTIGFILGACIILFRELRFSGVRSIDELRKCSDHNILASIPLISFHDSKEIISYLKNKPSSIVSEAVRNLRTSILMSNEFQAPQVIMLTSSIPKEGKTILTFALAQNMVGLGKRILLIEADIRRNVYTVNIDRKKSVALVDVLTGDRKFKDVDPFVEELGFDILTASRSDMNAADLYASSRFTEFLNELREYYDYILIDSPPVLAVPDARLIGSVSDANIYIVEWNKTTRSQVVQGLDMLSSVGVNTIGLVLNQIDPHKIKSYGYISPYGYNAYGSEYYES